MSDIPKSNKTEWSELATTCPDPYLKEAILNIFIPYNVSWVKFAFNMDYLMGNEDECDGVTPTPTCMYWCSEPFNRPMGYPLWFFAAFPDVILWASEREQGFPHLQRIFQRIPEDELIGSNKKLTISVLKKIVQVYIDCTHKRFETV